MKGTVRRLIVVASLAISLVPPMLACSGETGTTDVATPTPTPPPAPADPAQKIVGTWRMVPEEAELRRLKVIDAALSGKAQKKEKLGKLTAEEEKLFKEWENKQGPEVKAMKAQLKFAKGCQFTFTDKTVTVNFDDEKFGPVDYTVVSATDANTTLKFDPGLGNGTETHSIDWTSDTRGTDHIKGSDGTDFTPLNIAKAR
jgi:hypothetical protein